MNIKNIFSNIKKNINKFIDSNESSVFLLKWSKIFWKTLMLIEIACLMVYFIFGLFENTFFYPFTSCAAVKYCSYSYSLLKYLSYFFYGICAIISTKIISALSLIFLDLVDSATNFYKKNKQ